MFGKNLALIFILLLFSVLKSEAQTKIIEALKQQVGQAKNDEQKLAAIFALCDERLSMSTDTLQAYASEAKIIAQRKNDATGVLKADYFLTFSIFKSVLFDSVIKICDANIKWLQDHTADRPLIISYSFLKGASLIRSNQYKKALVFFYNMLNDAEKLNDTLVQIKCNNSIGWVNMEMNQYAEAIRWFYKALRVSGNPAHYNKYSSLYANLASTYNNILKPDSAVYFIKKAIDAATAREDLTALANALNIRADIYMGANNNAAAEQDLNDALNIRKLIGDPFYILSDISQLAFFYGQIKQPGKGITLAKQGIDMAIKSNVQSKLLILYTALAQNYKVAGNDLKYAETLETIVAVKDSMYNVNSAQALAEMQARYNLQKTENIIIQQKLALVKKNNLLYGSLLATLLAVITALLLFKNYRRKQKMKMQATMLEERRLALNAVQKAEENERKRIAADLHDNMGTYASAISANVDDLIMNTSSDNTALRNMKNNAAEIMTNLRDTIWVLNKDEIFITGISDRIKNYVQKLGDSYPGISIEIKENITSNISLSPEHALNMLRIMQEAFHNAVKHSSCSQISIEIISTKQNHTVETGSNLSLQNTCLRLTDNGTGIITSAESVQGNGLNNMNARAMANGWQLNIKSLSPGGTIVELIA